MHKSISEVWETWRIIRDLESLFRGSVMCSGGSEFLFLIV